MVSTKTWNTLLVLTVAVCAYWIATGVGFDPYVSGGWTWGLTKTHEDGSNHPSQKDPATGISFPISQTFDIAKRQTFQLLGVGTRKKAILNIYSVGLYASSGLVKEFQKEKDSGPARCATILTSKSSKVVQLTFVMGIGPEKIAEAVSGLKGVDKTVRQDFHDMIIAGLGSGKLTKHAQMTFEWKGLDTISVTARGGKSMGSIKHKGLARGVLELYVGPKSVSPSLLQSLQCR